MLRSGMLAMGFCLAASAALAGERRTVLSVSGAEVAPALTVRDAGLDGATLATNELRLRLDVAAALDAETGSYRLIASKVFLKAQGGAQGIGIDAIVPGSTEGKGTREVSFTVDALGPVAQNARSACAAADRPNEVAMLVPVVLSVTTGQFAFTRLAAGGLQPEEGMLSDPAYYGDTLSEDAEAAIPVTVICEASKVASVGEPPAQKGKSPSVAKSKPAATSVPRTPAGTEPASTSASLGVEPLRCEGGIVRETLAGPGHEVCLCPGNTARRQTGERAYACESRYARRR